MAEKKQVRRGAILDLLASQGRALHAREIATHLGVEEAYYPALLRQLDDLAYAGAISLLSGQRFRAKRQAGVAQMAEREGILSVNPRGFGFVAGASDQDDLYIQEESMGGAMHGDVVSARLIARSSRGSEGEIVRIVRRANAKIAGVLRRRGRSFVLEPDDARLRGPVVLAEASITASAQDGDAAVAKIARYPDVPREVPEAEIEAVLGKAGDPRVEIAKILVREGVDSNHPRGALDEAEAYGLEVPAESLSLREDLTHLPLPTIDPEDARDHDDAVWARREEDGSYTAWVAIADVSHYVKPGTELDKEARARGCSVYLPDRAIPMLPPSLSSHLCSLVPDAVRLCLCVEARLDPAGVVTSYRIFEAFMRSAAKLTYGEVARTLKFTDQGPKSSDADALVDSLRVLADLSVLLRRNRMRRGALDLDLPEPRLLLDPETGSALSIERRGADPGVKKAYQLVEEMMLLANEIVARFLTEKEVPTIYRVHGPPDEEKLDRFATMCRTLGIAFEVEEAKDPKRLSALLKRVRRHPSHGVFHMLLLRAMRQAVYDTTNIGHFGLASTHYLHFTSPIRRYPDLVVHRTLRELLRNQTIDRSGQALEKMRESATLSSERERHAMDIEREAVDLYRAIYMRDHLGESFRGRATGLVGSGVFVQLDSPFVDVLIKNEDLGRDEYQLDDNELRIVGARSGDSISLGDEVELEIIDVVVQRRTVYGRRMVAERGSRKQKRERQEVGSGEGRGRRGKVHVVGTGRSGSRDPSARASSLPSPMRGKPRPTKASKKARGGRKR